LWIALGIAGGGTPALAENSLRLGGDVRTGNTEVETYKSALTLEGEFGQDKFGFTERWNHNRVNRKATTNLLRMRTGYDWFHQEEWSPFIFAEYEEDQVNELLYDHQTGGGLKWTYYRGEVFKGSISGAGLHRRIKYRESKEKSNDTWSIRPKFKWKTERFSMLLVSYYQPNVKDSNDYKTNSVFSVSYRVEKTIEIFYEIENIYRNKVEGTVRKNNNFITFGLGVFF